MSATKLTTDTYELIQFQVYYGMFPFGKSAKRTPTVLPARVTDPETPVIVTDESWTQPELTPDKK